MFVNNCRNGGMGKRPHRPTAKRRIRRLKRRGITYRGGRNPRVNLFLHVNQDVGFRIRVLFPFVRFAVNGLSSHYVVLFCPFPCRKRALLYAASIPTGNLRQARSYPYTISSNQGRAAMDRQGANLYVRLRDYLARRVNVRAHRSSRGRRNNDSFTRRLVNRVNSLRRLQATHRRIVRINRSATFGHVCHAITRRAKTPFLVRCTSRFLRLCGIPYFDFSAGQSVHYGSHKVLVFYKRENARL